MKILWIKSDFLHPTTRGGQIRTLEMLKRLRPRHEIHYVAFHTAGEVTGVLQSKEYCTRAYPITHRVPQHASAGFWAQVAGSAFSNLPLAVSRYRSDAMQRCIAKLSGAHKFEAIVCDFLFPAQNIGDLSEVLLFQHNVEAQIWKRRAERAQAGPHRLYIRSQYQKMRVHERHVCRTVKRVIAVSDQDKETMRAEYGVNDVHAVPTGVDHNFFGRPTDMPSRPHLVFVGSMDWMPNIDGVRWFTSEVLPRIRKRVPDCTVTIAGRRPGTAIRILAARDAGIRVTGTVADIRPYLWEAAVSIVPLRIGGGTRLKIFEAMAAEVPVVSTTVGAEGLDVQDQETISIADSAEDFAGRCVELLCNREASRHIGNAAREMVAARYSWEAATASFERLLL